MLVVVDHFSKWTELIPLKDTNAITIARALLDNWCCRYGVPTRLHSDGASNVHGNVVKELCRLIGVGKSKSSRLHPQGDGKAEAYVKILKSCIVKHAENNPTDWDHYVQPAAFAIRSSVSKATGCCPSELVMGRKLRSPADLVIDVEDDEVKKGVTFNERQAKRFVRELTKRVRDTVNTTRRNLEKSRNYQKVQYDKNTKNVKMSIGETVMLWYPYHKTGISKCFVPKWTGPWKVTAISGTSNCRIKNAKGESKWVNFDQLKRVETRVDTFSSAVDEKLDDATSTCNDLFDIDVCADNSINEGEHVNDAMPQNDNEPGTGSWCEVDVNNILPHRTRSGTRGEV